MNNRIRKSIYCISISLVPFLGISGDAGELNSSNQNLDSSLNMEGISALYTEIEENPESFDLENRIVKNYSFSGRCLDDIDFSHWTFYNVSFESADLRKTNLKGAKFYGVELNRARLGNGLRFDSNLSNMKLVKQYSDFRLNGEVEKAKSLNKVLGPLQLNLERKNLGPYNLSQINFENACLCKAKLQNANLKNAVLVGADMRDADLGGASLKNANLDNANLNNSILKNANLRNATLKNVFLIRANLLGAKLEGSDFSGAQLQNSNLKNVVLENTNFSQANLENANIDGFDKSRANLTGANLSGTGRFSGKILKGLEMLPGVLGSAFLYNLLRDPANNIVDEIYNRISGMYDVDNN